MIPLSLSPQRIALLLGGASSEREVSLESGHAVAEGLAKRGHQVTKIDPADEGFYQTDWSGFDVVFIALHGSFGEDGEIQTYLDAQDICYTGSNAKVSRLAFDKILTKEFLLSSQQNIPTPPFVSVTAEDDLSKLFDQIDLLKYPLVVKPNKEGSSIGVSLVSCKEELPAALSCCRQFGSVCLIEKRIIGSEWTLAFIDDEPLPLIQLKTNNLFYDYAAKYQSSETEYLFDFDFPENVKKKIISVGVQTAQAIGTHGIARIDMMLDNQHQPWILEVNTIPGMTSHSLVPKAAMQAGICLPELCERVVLSALKS
ncbi:D-alanine--D-alanine ligase [hydrothermal vent metagenome]|uniref:D-alanine--D-alanine ligase n=1 Tax=hydrothermal vent metagenome TaxID=652676 RepID=A0A3B1DIE6_9ZZZZ